MENDDDPFDLSGGCTIELDGMPAPCSAVSRGIDSGSIVGQLNLNGRNIGGQRSLDSLGGVIYSPGIGTGLTIRGDDGSIIDAIPDSFDELPFFIRSTGLTSWGLQRNLQSSVTPQPGIWETSQRSYWAKLVQGFNAIQTDNCKNFIEGVLNQYGISTTFESLLAQARFHLYNPGADVARSVWAPGGVGYRQLNTDVQSVGRTLQGLFSEGWPGRAVAVTLGNNVYLSAENFMGLPGFVWEG